MACLAGDHEVPDSPINSYALVAYLPEPLAGCVEAIRIGVQTEDVRAHVTILPPRPLFCLAENAAMDLERAIPRLNPFDVELCEVQAFDRSHVLYLSIGEGAEALKQLNGKLSCGRFQFREYFDYHPHVTLAHSLSGAELERAAEKAMQQWNNYAGPRRFPLDRVTLVQNTHHNRWRNLQEFHLNAQVAA